MTSRTRSDSRMRAPLATHRPDDAASGLGGLGTESPPSSRHVPKGGVYPMIPAIYLIGLGVLLLRLAIGTIRASRLQSCVAPITVGIFRPGTSGFASAHGLHYGGMRRSGCCLHCKHAGSSSIQ